MPTHRYDTIGRGYTTFRRPDPRIATQIWAAVGEADRIVNVGAGTGSYERTDRRMVAVEPSAVMVSQRDGRIPVVRAAAESLPFPDGSFDVALALMTVHHWSDLRRGLDELRRVARRGPWRRHPARAHPRCARDGTGGGRPHPGRLYRWIRLGLLASPRAVPLADSQGEYLGLRAPGPKARRPRHDQAGTRSGQWRVAETPRRSHDEGGLRRRTPPRDRRRGPVVTPSRLLVGHPIAPRHGARRSRK
jgi:SAM-dependent methyltransferase